MFGLTPYERKNSAMTYDPFKAFENFEREFFKTNGLAEFKTDIRDNGKEYELEADLPGFKKEDINIELDDTYLTIQAERKSETEEKDKKGNYVRRERSYGSFSRSFSTEGVDFVMTAMFVVIFLNQWEKEKQHYSGIIGLAVPLVCLVLFGSGSFLLPSMACILVLLLVLRKPIERADGIVPGQTEKQKEAAQ